MHALTTRILLIAALAALAGMVHGSVVYTDPPDAVATGSPKYIDLDGNGTSDFQYYFGSASGWGSFVAVGPVLPYAGNAVGASASGLYLTGFDIGDTFGPGAPLYAEPSLAILQYNSGLVQGAWGAIGAEHFAGLRLMKDGQPHYGWVRLRNVSGVTAIHILDFAYETEPGVAIAIGDGLPSPADLDRDGAVDGADLGFLLAAWGTDGPGDLDGSGTVDGADLGLLLASWSE